MRTRAWRRHQRSKNIEHWYRIIRDEWRVRYRWKPSNDPYKDFWVWAAFLSSHHRDKQLAKPKYRKSRHLTKAQYDIYPHYRPKED